MGHLKDFGEESGSDFDLDEVIEAIERGDSMFEGLTGRAGLQAIGAVFGWLGELVVGAEFLVVVAVSGVAGAVIFTRTVAVTAAFTVYVIIHHIVG